MLARRSCRTILDNGQPSRATPRTDSDHCFWHDPETAEAAQEARRLGGQRRRREGVLAGVYEFNGLRTVEDIRRLLDVAALDTLGLDNSVARSRTLVAVVQAAAKLLEVGELEERLQRLEATLEARPKPFKAVGA